jgi:hypothetical protein
MAVYPERNWTKGSELYAFFAWMYVGQTMQEKEQTTQELQENVRNCVARLQGGQKQRNQDSVASEASDVEFIRRKDYENFGAHFTAETARAHEVAATRAGNGGSLVARMEALQGACGAAPTFFIDELTSGGVTVPLVGEYAAGVVHRYF